MKRYHFKDRWSPRTTVSLLLGGLVCGGLLFVMQWWFARHKSLIPWSPQAMGHLSECVAVVAIGAWILMWMCQLALPRRFKWREHLILLFACLWVIPLLGVVILTTLLSALQE